MEFPVHVLQVGMSPYYGGTEAFIMSHYREIDRTKVQFDFLNVFNEEIACEQEIRELGGMIYHLNMERHKGLVAYHQNMKRFFMEYADRFQIIHCNYQSLINIDCLIYAKKYGIPIRIAHAHNSGYGHEPNWMQKLIIARNSVRLKTAATAYFACSELAANWMFHRNADIIKNSIDASRFRFSTEIRDRVRKKLGFTQEKVLISVGRLDPQKNPLFLLDIMHELVKKDIDYRLLIVGDGILKKDVEEKITKLNLQQYVSILGTRTDVEDLLQAADYFVLPSLFEGLGIVLIEAQAAGLPCFTSEGLVPASVRITDLLHFIPLNNNSDEWAERINSCETDRNQDTFTLICANGYEISQSVRNLENKYLSFVHDGIEAT